MKVYATVKNDKGDIVLKEWQSAKAFLVSDRWCDPKFINIATTKDLKGYEFYPSSESKSFIVYTPAQIKSHELLYYKFHALRAKGQISNG